MAARMSYVDGGVLPPLPVATLGAALTRAAGSAGGLHHLDEHGRRSTRSYRELAEDATAVLGGLRAAGARPGEHVVLQLAHGPDLLTAFWAAVLGGLVAVPVSAQAGADQLAAVGRVVGDAWLVSDVADRGLGGVEDLAARRRAVEPVAAESDDVALLLLTAGSSGAPKAVRITHRNVLSRSYATALARGLDEHTRSLNWLPLDHVGGLVMFHLRDVFLRCEQTHARTDWVRADPLRWLDAASRYRADTTWAHNFAFGLVADRAADVAGRDWDLSRLRYVMNGGEAVRAPVVRAFLDLLAPHGLPASAVHPGWGMCETSAGVVDRVFDAAESTGRYVPVGRPHPGVALRVVDERGEVVPEGRAGRLQVRGAPVSPGYHADPVADAAAFAADGWFTADDLAFVQDGLLTVTGRADDVIEVDDERWHGHEVEAVVEELPDVTPTYTAACLVHGRPAVVFHPRPGTSADQAADLVRAHLLDRLGLRVDLVEPVAADDVPKTGSGKLRRAEIAVRLAARAQH